MIASFTVVVTVTRPGWTADEMDRIAELVEEQLAPVTFVESLKSSVSEGQVTTTVSFRNPAERTGAESSIRQRMNDIADRLPPGVGAILVESWPPVSPPPAP